MDWHISLLCALFYRNFRGMELGGLAFRGRQPALHGKERPFRAQYERC